MLKKTMRLGSIIVVCAVLLSIMYPVHINISTSETGKLTVITTLDVCHSDTAKSTLNSDIPAISETPFFLCDPFFQEIDRVLIPPAKGIQITSQTDYPPRFYRTESEA